MANEREILMSKEQWRAQRGGRASAPVARTSGAAPRRDGGVTPEAVKIACKLAGLPESFGTDMLAEGISPDEALLTIARQQPLSERMAEKFGKRGANG